MWKWLVTQGQRFKESRTAKKLYKATALKIQFLMTSIKLGQSGFLQRLTVLSVVRDPVDAGFNQCLTARQSFNLGWGDVPFCKEHVFVFLVCIVFHCIKWNCIFSGMTGVQTMKLSFVNYEFHTGRGDFHPFLVYIFQHIPIDLHKGGVKRYIIWSVIGFFQKIISLFAGRTC